MRPLKYLAKQAHWCLLVPPVCMLQGLKWETTLGGGGGMQTFKMRSDIRIEGSLDSVHELIQTAFSGRFHCLDGCMRFELFRMIAQWR